MDNKINDKDLEFVNGGAAATSNLLYALYDLRSALSLFTDDMPESAKTRIARTADLIDRGDTDVSIYKHIISTAINELKSFKNTLVENPDKFDMVHQILYHLNNALSNLNH